MSMGRMAGQAATTTSPTGMNKSADSHRAAFTLIELILVMALLATSWRLPRRLSRVPYADRNLRQEAARFVALTEFARSEAISRGIPMIVWVDSRCASFWCGGQTGF
jgi:prepilin-type N-terminal cleavage/methylation domain-containing protein